MSTTAHVTLDDNAKAYVFNRHGGPEVQELLDWPVPKPGHGELGVEVRAAGVNPGDWKLRSGQGDQDQEVPVVMGNEVTGVVTAVGDGVEGYAVGDEILGLVAPGHGGFAEHTIVRAADAVAMASSPGYGRLRQMAWTSSSTW